MSRPHGSEGPPPGPRFPLALAVIAAASVVLAVVLVALSAREWEGTLKELVEAHKHSPGYVRGRYIRVWAVAGRARPLREGMFCFIRDLREPRVTHKAVVPPDRIPREGRETLFIGRLGRVEITYRIGSVVQTKEMQVLDTRLGRLDGKAIASLVTAALLLALLGYAEVHRSRERRRREKALAETEEHDPRD